MKKRSHDFLSLLDLEDSFFCLRKKKKEKKTEINGNNQLGLLEKIATLPHAQNTISKCR